MLRLNGTRAMKRAAFQFSTRSSGPALIRPLSTQLFSRSEPRNTAPTRKRRVLISSASERTQLRHHSQPASKSKVYEFNDIKQISEQPSQDRILIDVREPNEYSEGFIPTAINLPIKSQPDALMLPADEFEDRYGFQKPAADQEVVFYCRSGVRSSAAAQLAEKIGYEKIGEYRGSWQDWAAKGGQVGR